MNILKGLVLSFFLGCAICLPAIAQSKAGIRILTALRPATSEETIAKKIRDGNYVVFTNLNCLQCFKQLEDSMKTLTGDNSYALILLMKEEPLNIQSNIARLARTGIRPKSYFVYYYDVNGDSQLLKMLNEDPSPWLIQKGKKGIQLRTYSALAPFLEH